MGATLLHLPLYTLVSAARATDFVFAGGFRRVPVKGPVFVLATPRSGTTFLHHLLALDEQNFTHQRLYQTVFPFVGINRIVAFGQSLEANLKLPLSALVRAVNRNMFQNWRGIHSVGLDAEEEDESLFVYAIYTPTLYLLMPFINEMPWLINTDEGGAGIRRRMARDYYGSAQRHLYTEGLNAEGKMRTLLVKNVFLSSRLEMTHEAFDGARFIRLVRDPMKAIPSAMSLFFAAWQVHSPDIPRVGPETLALFKMFVRQYRRLHEEATGSNEKSVLTVHFESLVEDPIAELRKIYAFLGLPLSAQHEKLVAEELKNRELFKSRHHYSLADFGLSEHDVRAELFDIMKELGYEPGTSPPETPLHSSRHHAA